MLNKIEQLRKENEITQQRLADELGVSRQTVNSIENGKYKPSIDLAFKIAKFFHLKIEEIFFPKEDL